MDESNATSWTPGSAELAQAFAGVAPAEPGMTRAQRRIANQQANLQRAMALSAPALARVRGRARDEASITIAPLERRSDKRRRRTAGELLDAGLSQLSPDKFAKVTAAAVEDAIAGDDKARAWLTATFVGDWSARQRAVTDGARASSVNFWRLVVDNPIPASARQLIDAPSSAPVDDGATAADTGASADDAPTSPTTPKSRGGALMT